MAFLVVRGEQFALELGSTVLGGREEDALAAEPLMRLPRFAVIEHPVDGPSTIHAIGALPVELNGEPLGAQPVPLRHGDRIQVSGLVLAVGELRMSGRTAAGGVDTESAQQPGSQRRTTPTASTGGRLVRLSDRSVHHVPEEGLTMGRDPSSGLVLASRDVSRTHAVVEVSPEGYRLVDRSANGIWVNGERVEGARLLGQRDVIRVGGETFRFEADD